MTEIVEILAEIEMHILVFGGAATLFLGFCVRALYSIRDELKRLNSDR